MSSSLLIRQKLSQVLNILLRIPPLFILDAILLNNIQFSKYIDTSYLPVSYNDSLHKKNFLHNSTFSSDQLLDNKLNVSVENDINLLFFKTFLDNASILVMILVFLMALIIFLLPLKHLCNFYRNILIFWTALLSYRINNLYYDSIHHIDPNQDLFEEAGNIVVFLTQSNHIRAFVSHYICQMILATTFIHLAGIYRPFASFLAFLYLILPYQAFSSYTSPYRLYLIYLPSIVLVFSLIYPISSVIYNSQKTFYSLCDEINWIKAYMRDLGLFALIENQWNRLNIPYVFRIFWISRVVLQASVLLMEKNQENLNAKSMAHFFISVIFDTTFLLECLKHLLVRGCETMVAVLGMTSVLSGITYRIGCLIQSFLMIDDYEDRSIGSISAILFFIIALQNDLTSMDPEKRLQRLYRSFYLLFAAMLHFFHNMVSPSLFSLSASRNLSFTRHFRALIVCAGLIISPYFFLIYLWNNHTLSTWLLAVSTFCIEVIVKVSFDLSSDDTIRKQFIYRFLFRSLLPC
ncbi:Protein TRC8 -like protein [Sarcoptes scabiei]|uniref:Protein TRC8 -like protein n=1 Tax=Sarcoptes scabiei TaxID=52283 RepID=A0A834VCN0_SARSC|nr:Protein TRC8 -like protein [Sarcoptes scabiei]